MVDYRDSSHAGIAGDAADVDQAHGTIGYRILCKCCVGGYRIGAGLYSGVTVALISPVMAYLLGIAPQILTVPAIMVGNTVYVVLLYFIAGTDSKKVLRRAAAWIIAATVKFATLYAIVVWLICGVFAERLMDAGTLKAPMLNMLPATFSWPQLITALIGGAVALIIAPLIRKALDK